MFRNRLHLEEKITFFKPKMTLDHHIKSHTGYYLSFGICFGNRVIYDFILIISWAIPQSPAVNSDDLSLPFRIQGNSWIIFLLIMAAIFWLYRLVKVIFNVLSYWEIRQFYKKALKIQMVRDDQQQDSSLKCVFNIMLCLVFHSSQSHLFPLVDQCKQSTVWPF